MPIVINPLPKAISMMEYLVLMYNQSGIWSNMAKCNFTKQNAQKLGTRFFVDNQEMHSAKESDICDGNRTDMH